ncbi:hypothetical protein A6R68_13443, partial [Neotoma lepida]
MALKNVPFRSEVLAWNPDSLADYFRKLNYRDCEKAVRKYHIDGARFLNLTENDIQKFPKLRMPLLSKLSQDINKNEERRSIFTRKPQVQRFPEETGKGTGAERQLLQEEEDDYESPNDDDPEGEDDGDYESPNEEEESLVDDAADYEPPPSNDEEALQNSILPAKPFPNTNSMYIDRPPTSKVSQQPPVPPQRPMAALPPLPTGRNHSERNQHFLTRTLGEHLPKIQKPPLPPAMDRHERSERSGPLIAKKPQVPNNIGFQQSASLPPYFSQDESFHYIPLDEEWYVSYVTRPEAEAALRKINQDGTFLVRDSSKKTVSNPYVLMVLYKDKVYNIQIRYQEESQVYLLGTGLRGK